MKFKTLPDVDVRGKRVVVREDLNVPMKDGAIGDQTRINAALQTLRYLHEHGAKTVILSHLGRPDGKPQDKYSLRPVAVRLSELLGTPVQFLDDCIGEACVDASHALMRDSRLRCVYVGAICRPAADAGRSRSPATRA